MIKKSVKVLLILVIAVLFFEVKTYAASFSITSSETTAEPNSDVTITITGNNVYGKIDLKGTNITLSETSVWLDSNAKMVTGKITGQSGQKATVTATPETDNLVNSEKPEEIITGEKSVTIEIKEKEVETAPPTTTPEPEQPAQEQSTTPTTTETRPPEETTTTPQAEVKDETKTVPKKTEPTQPAPEPEQPAQEIIAAQEDQGTPSEFGITEMRIYGVMPEGIKVELQYTPEFNINQPVYSCKLTNEMVNINVEVQANEYRDLLKVESPDEIAEGENIIRISMDDGNGRSKQYIIRALKEETEKTEEEIENTETTESEENENQEPVILQRRKSHFMLINARDFMGIILIAIVIENLLIFLIYILVKRIRGNTGKVISKTPTKNDDFFKPKGSGNLF